MLQEFKFGENLTSESSYGKTKSSPAWPVRPAARRLAQDKEAIMHLPELDQHFAQELKQPAPPLSREPEPIKIYRDEQEWIEDVRRERRAS
jgi:hypothetical protein